MDLLQHANLPDPVADAIRLVLKEHEELSKRLARVENREGIISCADPLQHQKITKEFEERNS
jgi:hypothetical protein